MKHKIDALSLSMQAQMSGEYSWKDDKGNRHHYPQAPATFVEGSIGSGKTAIVTAIAEQLVDYVYCERAPQLQPEDLTGYPIKKLVSKDLVEREHPTLGTIPAVDEQYCLSFCPPEWAIRLKTAKSACFIADEIGDAPLRLQSAFHGPLLDNRFGNVVIPNLTTVGIFNPPQVSTTGGKPSIAIATRTCILTDFCAPYEIWKQGARDGFSVPSFLTLPKDWQKRIRGEFIKMLMYLDQNEGSRNITVKEIKGRGMDSWKPAHTFRSWTNAAILAAACSAAKADIPTRDYLLAGCIGQKLSEDYSDWLSRLELGDPAEYLGKLWLLNGEFKQKRGDIVSATVSMVVSYYLEEGNRTKDNYRNLISFLCRTSDIGFEGQAVSELLYSKLASKSVRPKGFNPTELRELWVRFMPFLQSSTMIDRVGGAS